MLFEDVDAILRDIYPCQSIEELEEHLGYFNQQNYEDTLHGKTNYLS